MNEQAPVQALELSDEVYQKLAEQYFGGGSPIDGHRAEKMLKEGREKDIRDTFDKQKEGVREILLKVGLDDLEFTEWLTAQFAMIERIGFESGVSYATMSDKRRTHNPTSADSTLRRHHEAGL